MDIGEKQREKKDKGRTVAPECLIAVRGGKKVTLISGVASIFPSWSLGD